LNIARGYGVLWGDAVWEVPFVRSIQTRFWGRRHLATLAAGGLLAAGFALSLPQLARAGDGVFVAWGRGGDNVIVDYRGHGDGDHHHAWGQGYRGHRLAYRADRLRHRGDYQYSRGHYARANFLYDRADWIDSRHYHGWWAPGHGNGYGYRYGYGHGWGWGHEHRHHHGCGH
jgi:hypothetical protein